MLPDDFSRSQSDFWLSFLQGTAQGANLANEKKAKVIEQLRMIKLLFRRLRLIYEKCNENCQLQGMEYTHIESLIPLKEEWDMKSDEKKTSEAYRLACEDSKDVMEVCAKKIVSRSSTRLWKLSCRFCFVKFHFLRKTINSSSFSSRWRKKLQLFDFSQLLKCPQDFESLWPRQIPKNNTFRFVFFLQQVISKNRHLKEIIDHLRRIISEINTMLNMRRSWIIILYIGC